MSTFRVTMVIAGVVGLGFAGWEASSYLSVDSVIPADRSVPAPSIVEQSATIETAPPADRVAVDMRGASTSVPLQALKQLRAACAEGVAPGMDVRLPDEAAWDRFAKTWEELSVLVFRATGARDDVGIRIAQRRFENHQCQRIPESGMEKDSSGATKPVGVWGERRHPQEWVSTRFSYRDGEGQILEQVRIMPGEEPDLDAANLELALVIEMRSDAVRRLFADYETTPNSAGSSTPLQPKESSR